MIRIHVHFVGAALLLGAGCWSIGGGGQPAPGGGAITQTVGPMGAAITISAQGDPALAGTTLVIPAGALAQPTTISVSRGDEQASLGEIALGPSVRFAPDGLRFAKPATLILPWHPQSQ